MSLRDNIAALVRPSSAHRWMKCAASPQLEALFTEDGEGTEYQREGIVAHQIASACLVAPPGTEESDPVFYVGRYVDGISVTREMADAVAQYLDYVAPWRTAVGAFVAVEQPLTVPHLAKDGTPDLAVWNDNGDLDVFDLKYGRGVRVYAENNEQLRCYALAALQSHVGCFNTKKVRVHIAQPRIGHFDSEELTLAQLGAFEAELAAAVAAVYQPEPVAVAGSHCRFCRARGACRTYANQSAADVTQFDDLTSLEVPSPAIADLLTPRETAEILNRADDIRAWLKGVEDRAFEAIRAGNDIPGWKLVAGRSQRRWADEERAIELCKKKRLPIDTFMPRSFASVAQLEKAITPKLFTKYGFPHVMDKTEGAPTLAPATDKRPALVFSAPVEAFDDLTQVDDVASPTALADLLA